MPTTREKNNTENYNKMNKKRCLFGYIPEM